MIELEMIVAHDLNRAIGVDGALPWHLPQDLEWFKGITQGKAMIMGRKTYESIGKPLSGRTSIVITRQEGYPVKDGMVVVRSFAEAVIRVLDMGLQPIVVGGGQVYVDALPYTYRIYVTKVNTEVEDADTYFPILEAGDWDCIPLWGVVEGGKEICTVSEYTRKHGCHIVKADTQVAKLTDVSWTMSS